MLPVRNSPIAIGATLDTFGRLAQLERISRPDGRRRITRKGAGEESPGSTEPRCRITSGGGDPRESATENRPPGPGSGKGETVG